uniref:Steroid 17-alpha-hydroxylase/17,20 lyase n=1 Tax=Vombatus ursinus TaxID=29139 RepID=A0A4X2JX08_VOMUR
MWWFLIISLLILLYYIWQKLRSLGKKYPMCLPHLPILGSLIYLKSHEETHIYFTKLKEKYGQIYAFWLGSYYVVVVNHFSLAKEVLLKKGKEFACRPQMVTTDILTDTGKGIAFSKYGPQWRTSRKLVQSTFSLFKDRSSQNLEKIICQEANSLCKALANTQGQNTDPALVCFLASANVICQFCFSSSWKQDDEEVKTMMNFSEVITKTLGKDSLVDIFPWTQVQETIQKEIDQKIGFTRTPVLSDRHQLPFLEATVREVLRIRPVAPLLIPHVARTDTSIGEYTIPKDTRIYINLWSIHHDPTEWDEPEQFKPERFLDKNKEQLIMPTASYFPFGGGPRTCIGEFLARAELFLFLSWILQRFDLEVADDGKLPSLEGKFAMVFQILPFKLKFKLRKAWREAQLSA